MTRHGNIRRTDRNSHSKDLIGISEISEQSLMTGGQACIIPLCGIRWRSICELSAWSEGIMCGCSIYVASRNGSNPYKTTKTRPRSVVAPTAER